MQTFKNREKFAEKAQECIIFVRTNINIFSNELHCQDDTSAQIKSGIFPRILKVNVMRALKSREIDTLKIINFKSVNTDILKTYYIVRQVKV